jgi:nucleoside-diphosphate-sugar epimerase
MKPMRVMVTGHKGYVGSVLVPVLERAGHLVQGLDTDYYRGCDLLPPPRVPETIKDLRDVTVQDLQGVEAIVHLAALSNDPIGNLNSGWTEAINVDGTARLADAARQAGVRRFLFASSCIMYGVADEADVDERSPLNPQTDYAASKVAAESILSGLASDAFVPVLLRNGTIYGLSPRMRFDTVLNSLVGAALTTGRITVLGDGKPWRPVVHLRDVARAFLAVLEAPDADVGNQAINIGSDALNIRIADLAQAAKDAIPEAELEVLQRPDADQRTYRTSFAKFARLFPSFEFEFTPSSGAAELAASLRAAGVEPADYTSDRFTRLKRIRRLVDEGQVDDDLRWRQAQEAA